MQQKINEKKINVGACLVYHQLNGWERAYKLYLPRLGYWGDQNSEKILGNAVTDYCRSSGINFCISAMVPHENTVQWTKQYIELILQGETDEIFSRLRKKTRYVIRLADKNLKSETDNKFLPDFYAIYKARMLDKDLTFVPFDYFKNLLDHGSNYRIFVALQNNKVIAGMIFCMANARAYYLYNAANAQAFKLNANHCLMWHAISYYNSQCSF